MSELLNRYFGWGTNTDWTKCSSADCIEFIGAFNIDGTENVNDFEGLHYLADMIEQNRSSFDNGDASYGAAISFFKQIIDVEYQRDDRSFSSQNDFSIMLSQDYEESIAGVDIKYNGESMSIEFEGQLYTGMHFELSSDSQGVEPCTLFFGAEETVVGLTIEKSQSIFLARTSQFEYKPFCGDLQGSTVTTFVPPEPPAPTNLTITDSDAGTPTNLTITDWAPATPTDLTITEE